ncbi:unnamed protein product (macronuclear) [Paramecium tetraurelia]|uniref:Transmembrane protein n=1 Tax=Paramecium tetraurelia TaxID=5888 RepID=A0CZ98_PARTE|nr:uncharacterized protein GSPATT00011688001 [Paramecium tetraurelia]CAK76115.1 unnamed protein product [Paramecium tetraurelia]|eukprot:XP_001443512.1 hypothetical protein (macronuclear) [Paramecium tetraurelia strain d4-2]
MMSKSINLALFSIQKNKQLLFKVRVKLKEKLEKLKKKLRKKNSQSIHNNLKCLQNYKEKQVEELNLDDIQQNASKCILLDQRYQRQRNQFIKQIYRILIIKLEIQSKMPFTFIQNILEISVFKKSLIVYSTIHSIKIRIQLQSTQLNKSNIFMQSLIIKQVLVIMNFLCRIVNKQQTTQYMYIQMQTI